MPAIDAAHKPETSKRQDKRRTILTLRVNAKIPDWLVLLKMSIAIKKL